MEGWTEDGTRAAGTGVTCPVPSGAGELTACTGGTEAELMGREVPTVTGISTCGT